MKRTLIASAIALAVIGMSSAASAADVNLSYDEIAQGHVTTTKFNSGDKNAEGGNITVNVTTSAPGESTLNSIMSGVDQIANGHETDGLKTILGAIGVNQESQTAVLTGTAGGTNFVDINSQDGLGMGVMALALKGVGSLDQGVKILNQLNYIDGPLTIRDSSITLNIGDANSEPLMIATVGGDRLINANLAVEDGSNSVPSALDLEVIRSGNIEINAESGNLFLLTGGSSAINVSGPTGSLTSPSQIAVSTSGSSTKTTLNGKVELNLRGHVNAAGVLGAGSAIALGGQAASTLRDGVTLHIETQHDTDHEVSGNIVGVFAGGSAISSLGGTASMEIGEAGSTEVNIDDGVVGGLFGGGLAAALSAYQLDPILAGIGGENSSITASLGENSTDAGSAEATSQAITINIGSEASAAGIFGGGAALSYQNASAKKGATATSRAKDVTLTIGTIGGTNPFAGEYGINKKGEVFGGIRKAWNAILTNTTDPATYLTAFKTLTNTVKDVAGLTAMVFGGGLAATANRNSENGEGSSNNPVSDASVESVELDILSGYNAFMIGGGLAVGSGYGIALEEEAQNNGTSTMAIANVKGTSKIHISGGETVGVLGGGAALFAGSGEQHTGIGAQANVKTVEITADNGALVDGIFGGGIAVDDTNPKYENGDYFTVTNVQARVEKSSITITNANVNTLKYSAFSSYENIGQNSVQSFAYSALDAVENNHAAIIGGGIAAGLMARPGDEDAAGTGAGAYVGMSNIALGQGAVIGSETESGNVFGGGLAVAGGYSYVGTANVTLNGGTVHGNVYGGGLTAVEDYQAGSPDALSYGDPLTEVGTANITLASGHVTGSVLAGGLGENTAKAVVKVANVEVYDAVQVDESIDGTGAEKANLTFVGDVDMIRDDEASPYTLVKGFNTITASGHAENFDYDAAQKDVPVKGSGVVSINELSNLTGTMTVGEADAAPTFLGIAASDSNNTNKGTVSASNGVITLGGSGTLGQAAYNGKNAVFVTGNGFALNGLKVTAGTTSTTATSDIVVGSDAELLADANNTVVTGTVALEDGAGLRFVNVGAGVDAAEQSVTFTNEVTSTNISTDNILWDASSEDNQNYTFVESSTARSLDGGVYSFYNGLDADSPLRDRLDPSNYRGEANLKAGMNLAAAAGVQTAAIEGATLAIDAASKRAALTRDFHDGWLGFAEGTGIYNKMGGSGDMNEVKTEMGGVAVGGDYSTGDWTFGGLLNVGSGKVRGQGDNAGVKNEVDYYGVQAYVGKRFGDFNVVGQLGWTRTKNDLTDNSIGYSKVDDLDADVYTVGVRGEMAIAVSEASRLVPYIGINYLRVSTDGYTTSQGVKVDDVDQNLFTVPVGVAFTGTMTTSTGWNWTPSADLAYIGAFGDRDVDADVRAGDAAGSVSMDVWTESTIRARIGLEASKGGFGVGATLGSSMGSDDSTGLFGQVHVRYMF